MSFMNRKKTYGAGAGEFIGSHRNPNSNGSALSNLIRRAINGQVVVGCNDDGRDGSRWGFIVYNISNL
jgi:hypothetical protein